MEATKNATREHIENVRNLINVIVCDLLRRGEIHDQSKLGENELPVFVEFTPKLKNSTYGSDEYKEFLAEMKPALDHHYRENRHHPEHFACGVNDMNIVDVLEMLLDWKAATLRHADGDIRKSIKLNTERFGLSGQLAAIMQNTIRDYGMK